MNKKYKNIDEYILGFPKDVQSKLKKIRSIIKREAPRATEAIKYGIPTFVQNENIVHFAGYKHHIGFYPTPKVVSFFKKDISTFKYSKGAVQFPLTGEVPYSLIQKMVKHRVKMLKTK